MFVSLLCARCQIPGPERAEQCVCTGVLMACLCLCVHRHIDGLSLSLSLLQASVFWSISYYSSPFAFFYLYRKGQCGFKGGQVWVGGDGPVGHWPVNPLPEEKGGGPVRIACLTSLFYQESCPLS